MRWLSIDHGTKKIGLAFSDELEILASPFEVWPQEEERTLDRLARLCREEGVQALCVGLPRHKDGAESATAPAARAFGESLAARTGLPLRFVNEHLSSAEAERLLRERGVKPEKRKLLLDAAAAAVILSELLEDRRAKGIAPAELD
ncbi:MAG: Holliday junction resolvase RuvX [Geothrix sp.]|uniref:Holliday junction resolvase RuvX n=1 Tax=Geothrix sp. TaxID=1962974 RepID=UPI00181AF411|nr:Holliday junction resolvase RuvX [Geothrix sp.]NWJ41720.1 Holliday junction resolvase RuvX [Geothrix sp.]WIL20300.1 MAG: Holliday junction resolvase RuvX [Geothrix sp.]